MSKMEKDIENFENGIKKFDENFKKLDKSDYFENP